MASKGSRAKAAAAVAIAKQTQEFASQLRFGIFYDSTDNDKVSAALEKLGHAELNAEPHDKTIDGILITTDDTSSSDCSLTYISTYNLVVDGDAFDDPSECELDISRSILEELENINKTEMRVLAQLHEKLIPLVKASGMKSLSRNFYLGWKQYIEVNDITVSSRK